MMSKTNKEYSSMLNKRLCELYHVDKVDEFFVDYIDDLDDQLENEKDQNKTSCILQQKAIIQRLRQNYSDLRKRL